MRRQHVVCFVIIMYTIVFIYNQVRKRLDLYIIYLSLLKILFRSVVHNFDNLQKRN